MRARFLPPLLTALTLILLTACTSDSNADSESPDELTPAQTNAANPLDAPPATTVTAAGRTAEMAVGTYCWTSMCVDKVGPITKATLGVAPGSRITVAVPAGTPALREVSARAFPAAQPQDLGNGETAWRPDFDRGSDLATTRNGQTVEMAAPSAPGRYVLSVGMFFERGDVQYGVLLDVR